MNIEEVYQNELNLIRQNPSLLDSYKFDKNITNSKHFERLRLNIAVYNDLKPTDYEIVRFLFKQEKEWRKYGKGGDVDNLYFCAFVLTHFGEPEVILDFFETKCIDMDSSIGFDGEFLVAMGIEKTYNFLETLNEPVKDKILDYLGNTIGKCKYSNEDIERWKEGTGQYFDFFKYPIDSLHKKQESALNKNGSFNWGLNWVRKYLKM